MIDLYALIGLCVCVALALGCVLVCMMRVEVEDRRGDDRGIPYDGNFYDFTNGEGMYQDAEKTIHVLGIGDPVSIVEQAGDGSRILKTISNENKTPQNTTTLK